MPFPGRKWVCGFLVGSLSCYQIFKTIGDLLTDSDSNAEVFPMFFLVPIKQGRETPCLSGGNRCSGSPQDPAVPCRKESHTQKGQKGIGANSSKRCNIWIKMSTMDTYRSIIYIYIHTFFVSQKLLNDSVHRTSMHHPTSSYISLPDSVWPTANQWKTQSSFYCFQLSLPKYTYVVACLRVSQHCTSTLVPVPCNASIKRESLLVGLITIQSWPFEWENLRWMVILSHQFDAMSPEKPTLENLYTFFVNVARRNLLSRSFSHIYTVTSATSF